MRLNSFPNGAFILRVFIVELLNRTSLFEVSIANDLRFNILEEVGFCPCYYRLLFTVMVTVNSIANCLL